MAGELAKGKKEILDQQKHLSELMATLVGSWILAGQPTLSMSFGVP